MFGGNLPSNFPVIDRFAEGVVTSIKSIDLRAATYQNAGRLSSRINSYLNALARFEGTVYAGESVEASAISGRVLHLVVPRNSQGMMQRQVMDAIRVRAGSLGIELLVTPF